MKIETKKIFFKKLQVFLEDKLDVSDWIKKYYYISIVSQKQLDYKEWRGNWIERIKDTAVIDLNKSEEDIFKKFSDTTRNEIRRTYHNSDLVFSLNKNTEVIYDLYKDFEISQGRKPVSKNEINLFKSGLAYYKNEAIYGFFIIESFPYARIRSIFSKRLSVPDKDFLKIISNSGRRLLWDICLDLKKRHFISLDMASVNTSNPKTINIAKFKMSFGGDIIKEYTYIYKSKLFNMIGYILSFFN
jgi:lipid II:glycine glycyltransferase (peptidoglycan interpeptide bridge formation enzyme)